MKIPDAARLLAATEQERLGWVRYLKQIDDEYQEAAWLAYQDLITVAKLHQLHK